MDTGNHELHAIAQELTKQDQENASAASSSGTFRIVTALCPQDLERLCLNPSTFDQLRALQSAGMTIDPVRASLQGGGNFYVQFEERLPDFVELAHAVFGEREDGVVMVHKTTQGFNMHGERIPPGEKLGEVLVQVFAPFEPDTLVLLGTATFEYFDPEKETLIAVLQNPSLCGKVFVEIGNSFQKKGENDTSNSKTLGLGGSQQQSDILRKLTFTAAGIGDEEFIRLVFSTSAGQILFQAYKNNSPLPEEIAEANGHDKTAAFLRGITERFSKEGGTNRIQTKDINWFELARAVEEREAPSVFRPEIIARGSITKTAYNKALMEGRTVIKRAPIMLIGQDRVGKTSLKKSLIGNTFNPKKDSTLGIDVDSTHFKMSNEICKNQAKKAMTSDTHSSETSRYATEPIQTHEDLESDNSKYVPDASGDENLDAAQKITDETNFTENLNHEIDIVKEEEIYLVVRDFGGKSVNSAIHPLFLSPRALYLLVWNLSWNLHEEAIPDSRKGTFNATEDSFGAETNLDMLDYWMTSIASLVSQAEDRQVQPGPECEVLPVHPPVFLVCTHADQPCGGADPHALAREVFNSMQHKPYKKHLYSDVFVVDNTKSGMECECSEITRLRKKILTVADGLPQKKEFVPTKWLKYENILQVTKGHKWISLEKAKQIAFEECKIDDNQEFLNLLNFLHDQRVLIHFDDSPELNKLVVLDPLWLIDVFKGITVRPYDHEKREFKELWHKLMTTGIVEETLLKHVWDPLLVEQETFESLIAIMEKCSLLHPWPSSDASCSKQYLVPSMLMSHPPQDMIGMAASAHFPPLFLTPESNHVLPGLFYNFVSQFFHWIRGVWKAVIPQLYCNFARFCKRSDKGCSVMLVRHPSSVEVIVHEGDLFLEFENSLPFKVMLPEDLHTFEVNGACNLRRQLGLMLEYSRKAFCWLKNIRFEVGVICPVCCQGGAVNYCRTHGNQACMKEACLHVWTETELRSAKGFISCTRSAAAPNTKVEVEQFAPWIVSLDEQQGVEPDGGYLPLEEGPQWPEYL